jgi:hypothetical protein
MEKKFAELNEKQLQTLRKLLLENLDRGTRRWEDDDEPETEVLVL